MVVRDLMSTGIASLSPDTPASAVIHLPVEHGISGDPRDKRRRCPAGHGDGRR